MNGDRRQNGVRSVQITDGATGQVTGGIQVQGVVKRWHGICLLLISIITLLGLVAGAARLGVQYEVHDAIETETEPPNGAIFKAAEDCVEEETQTLRGELHKRITEQGDSIKEQISENRQGISNVETRQGDMVRQMERMEDRLLDAITNGHD